MIHSRDFFIPEACTSLSTNKSGTLQDVQAFAEKHHKILIQMGQVHGDSLAFISASPFTTKIAEVDAVITNNPKLLLSVRTADCLPILLYHPSGIVGVLHAGRKSTEKQLLAKVLTFLKDEKNIRSDISLWFGSAICEACYQIDRKTDAHYNLIAENMKQAYSVFTRKNIHITANGDCTQCLSEEYHSYRVEQAQVKMNYFAISLK